MDIDEYFATGPAFERPIFEVVRVTHGPPWTPDIWFEPVSVGIFFKRRTSFLQLRTMTKWVAVCFNLDRRLSSDTAGPEGARGTAVATTTWSTRATSDEVDAEMRRLR